jgi:hypothetical protein
LDDLIQIILHLHRPVRERRPADAALAEDAVEFFLVGGVVGDGGRRVLQLMAGENADDPVARGDDALLTQQLGAGDARGAGRFAAEAIGADLRLGVEHLLVGHLADDAVAPVEGP